MAEVQKFSTDRLGAFFRHFGLRAGEFISLTGGGGKTSLLHAMAHHLLRRGQKVLLTASAKMLKPSFHTLIMEGDIDDTCFMAMTSRLRAEFKKRSVIALLRSSGAVKLEGLAPEMLVQLHRARLVPFIISESDGSRQKALKAWAEHEPPIASCTSLLCNVLGADRLSRELNHEDVFRMEIMAEQFGFKPGDILTPERLAAILESPNGGLKNVPSSARRIVFINRSDMLSYSELHNLRARFLPRLAELLSSWDLILMGSLKYMALSMPDGISPCRR